MCYNIDDTFTPASVKNNSLQILETVSVSCILKIYFISVKKKHKKKDKWGNHATYLNHHSTYKLTYILTTYLVQIQCWLLLAGYNDRWVSITSNHETTTHFIYYQYIKSKISRPCILGFFIFHSNCMKKKIQFNGKTIKGFNLMCIIFLTHHYLDNV